MSPTPRINGSTRLLGVIGWPVRHSRSPQMHAAAIEAAGLDLAYVPMEVAPERLADAIAGLRALGFLGCNVTIPHKVGVAQLADELTPAARAIGAANTLTFRPDSSIEGHNTDAEGAFEALEGDLPGFSAKGATVLVLGAGGTARGVAWGAAARGAARVLILNRTVATAQALAAEMQGLWPGREFRALHEASQVSQLDQLDVVLQATSLGMKPADALPIDPAMLPATAAVLEAVYSPLETPFLAACRARGMRCVDGLSMLVAQGALSFERWTGIRPDRAAMRRAIT